MTVKAYPVIRVYLRNAPPIPLLIHTLPCPLFPRIIQIPAIKLPLRQRRLISKRIKLVYPSNPTRPLLNRIIHFPRLILGSKVETDECEIPASQTNRRWLTRRRGCRTQRAQRNYRVGNPEFSRSDGGPLGWLCLGLVGCRGRRNVGEDEMVRGEMEVADNLLTTARQGHIINLPALVSVPILLLSLWLSVRRRPRDQP